MAGSHGSMTGRGSLKGLGALAVEKDAQGRLAVGFCDCMHPECRFSFQAHGKHVLYGVWIIDIVYIRGPAGARRKHAAAIRRPLVHAQVTSACTSGRRFWSSFFFRAVAGPPIKSEHSAAVTLLIMPLRELH